MNGPRSTGRARGRALAAAVGVAMAAGAAAGLLTARHGLVRAGLDAGRAWWVLAPIVVLHLVQLALSGEAWRGLLARPTLGRVAMFRLRLIREAVNSLLPVAHVGGDIVGARLLGRAGAGMPEAAASVVVDLTLEVAALALFLLLGLAALAACAGTGPVWGWVGSAAAVSALAGAMLAAQRLGVLGGLEAVGRRIADRWSLPPADALHGLAGAAHAIYRRPRAVWRASGLHLASWLLGVVETWAILHALGEGAGWRRAAAIEALGMAARVAGFAVPGALGVQEGGFVLAALAVGLAGPAGLAVSLVKRVREVLVGLAGLGAWAGWRHGEGQGRGPWTPPGAAPPDPPHSSST